MIINYSKSEMAQIGVYKVINLNTNRFYVGSTIWRFDRRLRKHQGLLEQNKHYSKLWQQDWNEFGNDSFQFEILEFTNKVDAQDREQYYLDLLQPYNFGYNIATSSIYGAGRPQWLIDHVMEKLHSPENEQKKIEATKQWFLENNNPVNVYTLDGEFIRQFHSVKALQEFSYQEDNDLPIILKGNIKNKKLRDVHIHRVITGKRTQMKGLVFKYADNDIV